MKRAAAEAQEFEQAALERNRLRGGALAARAPARRQRVGRDGRRGRGRGRGHRRQRPGLPGPRRRAVRPPVLLPRQRGPSASCPRSPRSSSSSTTRTAMSIPPQVVVQREVGAAPALAEALAQRRGGPGRDPRGRARRQAPHPRAGRAQRPARARPGAPQGRAPAPAPRRGARRPAGGAGPRRAADADRVLRHLQPGRHPHRRLDGRLRGRRAEEVRLPPLHDPHGRGLGRLRRDGGGARAAAGAVGAPARHLAPRPRARPELRGAAQRGRDRRRQGPALKRPARAARASASAASR